MLTAIILTATIVIAVVMYSLCKVSGECAKVEESTKWAKEWNNKWTCLDDCKTCEEAQFCKLKDEV